MRIELSSEQYADLLRLVSIGAWVEETVRTARSEPTEHVSDLEQHLFRAAEGTDAAVHVQKDEEELVPHESIEDDVDTLLDEYEENIFAQTLAHRLAERDFLENASEFERAEVEATGEMPERVHDFCGSYHREFAEHGVSRLHVLTMDTPKGSDAPDERAAS